MLLQDRIALITASGSGMGRAAAQRLAREGATVVVADVDLAAAEGTVKLVSEDGGKAVPYRIDVTDLKQLRQMFAFVEDEFRVLHVLHNHAGVPGAAGRDITEDDWNLSADVNMKSVFFGTSYAVPLLRRAGGKASVILTASVTGVVGSPFSPLYSMHKGGVVNFARAAAVALAPDIRVNVICPGPVDTPMLPRFFGRDPGADIEGAEAYLRRDRDPSAARVPAQRDRGVGAVPGQRHVQLRHRRGPAGGRWFPRPMGPLLGPRLRALGGRQHPRRGSPGPRSDNRLLLHFKLLKPLTPLPACSMMQTIATAEGRHERDGTGARAGDAGRPAPDDGRAARVRAAGL